jgi:hypothetical protein
MFIGTLLLRHRLRQIHLLQDIPLKTRPFEIIRKLLQLEDYNLLHQEEKLK